MQRKVNRSDSDYHYDEEKHKRNVVIMIRKCKFFLRENAGAITDCPLHASDYDVGFSVKRLPLPFLQP